MSEAVYKIKKTTLDAIGNAIRQRTGETELIPPLEMPYKINSMGGIDFKNQTVTKENVENGVTFYDQEGFLTTGTGSFRVIGSTTQPENPLENTIWVNTTVDEEISKRKARVTWHKRLSTYIDDNGKITSPSSNTCYTYFFACQPGHEYNFKLNDAQTVRISSFTTMPATGVTGTNLYGNGKETGLSSLDYPLTAPADAKYLAIWLFDSSKTTNSIADINLVITDNTLKDSIKAEMSSEIPISKYSFSKTNTWINADEKTDLLSGKTVIRDKYINNSGNVTAMSSSSTNYPCYAKEYIPVEYGKDYEINYSIPSKKSMWLWIAEYTGFDKVDYDEGNEEGVFYKDSYTFLQTNQIINDVSGTTQKVYYTPSAGTTAIRISWRTFNLENVSVSLSIPNEAPIVSDEDEALGLIWFETDNEIDNNYITFDALANNNMNISISAIRQWDGIEWQNKEAYIYQNSMWKLIPNTYVFFPSKITTIKDNWESHGAGSGTFMMASNALYLYGYSDGSYWKFAKNLIDFSKYKTLKIKISGTTSGYETAEFKMIWKNADNVIKVTYRINDQISPIKTHSIDISDITDYCYCDFKFSQGGGGMIAHIWFEE